MVGYIRLEIGERGNAFIGRVDKRAFLGIGVIIFFGWMALFWCF